jgi:ferredoxin
MAHPTVTFRKSNLQAEWTGDHDNILELAEANALDLPFGCRMGNCTACQQPLVSGEVDYPMGHNGQPEPGNQLLCCSVPKTDVVIDA